MNLIGEFITEILLELICGWVGCTTVRILSFGRWKLDLEDSCECIIAISVGFIVLAALAFAAFFLISPHTAAA